MRMHSLVIFASGAGSNAAAIIDWCRTSGMARVSLIVCNKPGAGVIDIAAREGIPVLMIEKGSLQQPETIDAIRAHQPSLVILAGYLWKIPATLTDAFPGRIVNIHPSLLPAYGGKGMYGGNVHTAVIAAREHESGITIHYVNEHYDEGDIIVQARCPVTSNDTPATLAARIHRLEHFFFPRTIEFLLMGL